MPDREFVCTRCGRPIVPADLWWFNRRPICDRVACVASATHRLVRGVQPDNAHELTDKQAAAVIRFDKNQARNRPAPPPWARRKASA